VVSNVRYDQPATKLQIVELGTTIPIGADAADDQATPAAIAIEHIATETTLLLHQPRG
jgi:hypothetical protein